MYKRRFTRFKRSHPGGDPLSFTYQRWWAACCRAAVPRRRWPAPGGGSRAIPEACRPPPSRHPSNLCLINRMLRVRLEFGGNLLLGVEVVSSGVVREGGRCARGVVFNEAFLLCGNEIEMLNWIVGAFFVGLLLFVVDLNCVMKSGFN